VTVALPYLEVPLPFVMAHRGFDLTGLENSMPAFAAAVDLGVTHLETDVHATSDGVLVAFHDARLDRTTDGQGVVAELPWSQVSRARIGGVEPIPRFEDVLSSWPGMRLNVDLKSAGAVRPFVEAIRRAGALDRVCVASFSDRRRAAAVRALTGLGRVAWSPGSRGVARLLAALPLRTGVVGAALGGAACVQLPERIGPLTLLTRRLVDAVHAAGVQVHAWTIDDPAIMHRLLDLGIDALITNRADIALEVLEARADPKE
jgi:glycerophosphoryl diester phosphodiesterase